jgi:LAS superfamily LD-carboxypeptidase LdcB
MKMDGNLMLSTLQNQLFTLHQLDGREQNIADGQWSAFKRIIRKGQM